MNINLDNFCCNILKCEQSIVWDCGEGICTSCKLIGQSYSINKKPIDCLHSEKVDCEIKNQVETKKD